MFVSGVDPECRSFQLDQHLCLPAIVMDLGHHHLCHDTVDGSEFPKQTTFWMYPFNPVENSSNKLLGDLNPVMNHPSTVGKVKS